MFQPHLSPPPYPTYPPGFEPSLSVGFCLLAASFVVMTLLLGVCLAAWQLEREERTKSRGPT